MKVLIAVLGLALLTLAAACGGEPASGPTESSGIQGQVLLGPLEQRLRLRGPIQQSRLLGERDPPGVLGELVAAHHFTITCLISV